MKKETKKVSIGTAKKKPKTQIEKTKSRVVLINGQALALFLNHNEIEELRDANRGMFLKVEIPVQDNDFPELCVRKIATITEDHISLTFGSEQSFEMIKD